MEQTTPLFDRTPSEKSTWELQDASMKDLVEAFDAAMIQPPEQDPARMPESGGWVMPERVLTLGNLVVAETIRVLRTGTSTEVLDAANVLGRCVLRHHKEPLEEPFTRAFNSVRAASHVIHGTIMPAKEIARGYDLLRESQEAAKVVCILAEAERLRMTRQELIEKLGYNPNLLPMDREALVWTDTPAHDSDWWSDDNEYRQWLLNSTIVGLAGQALRDIGQGKPSELLAVARFYAEQEPHEEKN